VVDRRDVFNAINTERSYQEKQRKRPLPIENYLVKIQGELFVAEAYISMNIDLDTPKNLKGLLGSMRKIAALAVAAMEEHGAPLREHPVKDAKEKGA
jgi:hypothetical protein